MGNTLGILLGKNCSVDGCWLGSVNAVSISYEEDHLTLNLEVLVDDDGLDRLREYAKIVQIFEGDDDGRNQGNEGSC
jgi:hypothetical protein